MQEKQTLDKGAFGLFLLRGSPEAAPLQREIELIQICNKLSHGQIPNAFPGQQPTSLTRLKMEEYFSKETSSEGVVFLRQATHETAVQESSRDLLPFCVHDCRLLACCDG